MNENKNKRNANKRNAAGKKAEGGYLLVGLMAVMMFGLILTTAAAPSLKQEMQREKEEEMLWRGQQVAMAIRNYRRLRGGMFPTDLTDLVKITEVNGKRIRLLRPSALCDPMTPCKDETNWRMVHPGDSLPKTLLDAIVETQEKSQMPINPAGIQELARFAQMGAATNLPGRPADTQLDGNIGPVENQGADSGSGSGLDEKKAPIIGVVSRKNDNMFRSYYGIEKYDEALFFPDVPVLAGGFVNPLVLGSSIVAGGGAAGKDPSCPGGYVINGQCTGALLPGKNCRVEVSPKVFITVPCSSVNK
jgi:type II secretory pathway pseudopilin PulG